MWEITAITTCGSVKRSISSALQGDSGPSHLHVLQEDPPSSVVLEGHELLGVLPLLEAVLLEEVGKARQRYVVTAEIESLGT